jgi:hypothetical protein
MFNNLVFKQVEGQKFFKASVGKLNYLIFPNRRIDGHFDSCFHFEGVGEKELGTFSDMEKACTACGNHYWELADSLLAKPKITINN